MSERVPPAIFQCRKPGGNDSDAVFDSEYEREDIPDGATQVWYWYEQGCYEGSGEALIRFDESGFDTCNMGHCSCYGPTDSLKACRPSFDTLAELTAGYTKERQAEFRPLMEAATAWLASTNPPAPGGAGERSET